jgi:hypothetical protein
MFQPLQDHLQGARNLHLLYIQDGLVRAETYVGVKEYKSEKI